VLIPRFSYPGPKKAQEMLDSGGAIAYYYYWYYLIGAATGKAHPDRRDNWSLRRIVKTLEKGGDVNSSRLSRAENKTYST
jgi:hypothetical protein